MLHSIMWTNRSKKKTCKIIYWSRCIATNYL